MGERFAVSGEAHPTGKPEDLLERVDFLEGGDAGSFEPRGAERAARVADVGNRNADVGRKRAQDSPAMDEFPEILRVVVEPPIAREDLVEPLLVDVRQQRPERRRIAESGKAANGLSCRELVETARPVRLAGVRARSLLHSHERDTMGKIDRCGRHEMQPHLGTGRFDLETGDHLELAIGA
jgi:hypothetical protein